MSRGTFAGTQRLSVGAPIGISVFTIHTWVYLPVTQAANNRIWQLGNSIGLGFQLAGTKIQIVDEAIAWRGAGVIPASLNAWFSIGVTRNGGNYSLYHEGSLIESPTAGPQALSGAFVVGNSVDATHSLNGYVAGLTTWSVALSANEILSLKRGMSPLLIQPASLQGCWPLWGQAGVAVHEPDLTIRQRTLGQIGNPGIAGNPATPSPVPAYPL